MASAAADAGLLPQLARALTPPAHAAAEQLRAAGLDVEVTERSEPGA